MCKQHAIIGYSKRVRRVNFFLDVLAAVFFIAAILLIGTMDYQDELLEQKRYCKNVRDNVWPDYLGTFKRECEEEK
jgi:hypothetical protein